MKKILLLSIFFFLLTSCVTNKFINKSVKASEIRDVAYFEPLSYVSLIEKGNKTIFNDSLSEVSKNLLDSIIQTNQNFSTSKKIVLLNSILKNKVEVELNSLMVGIIRTNKIEGVRLTTSIDSILKANKQRFALATVTSGFGRKKGNYGGQVAKAMGIGILTLGMYAPIPIKSSSSLFTMILDSETNSVVYFSKSTPSEQSPTVRKTMEKNYKELYKGYFYDLNSTEN